MTSSAWTIEQSHNRACWVAAPTMSRITTSNVVTGEWLRLPESRKSRRRPRWTAVARSTASMGDLSRQGRTYWVTAVR